MISIQQIDPVAFASAAGRILQEAWPAPCMHYSAEYLAWQFGFPGSCPGLGMAAMDGDEPVGFIGATMRNLRWRGDACEAYCVSFLAVRPDWRGQRLPARLYGALLEVIRTSALPTVTFAEPESSGEKILLSAYSNAGFKTGSLGDFPIHGHIPRPNAVETFTKIEVTRDHVAFVDLIGSVTDEQTLWNVPDVHALMHYTEDPRERLLLLCRNQAGDLQGGAMVMRSEVKSADRILAVATVDNLFLREPSSDLLRALCLFAQNHWAGRIETSIMFPNVQGIDPAMLRGAGIRQTSGRFRGYISASIPHPFLEACRTNLEII